MWTNIGLYRLYGYMLIFHDVTYLNNVMTSLEVTETMQKLQDLAVYQKFSNTTVVSQQLLVPRDLLQSSDCRAVYITEMSPLQCLQQLSVRNSNLVSGWNRATEPV